MKGLGSTSQPAPGSPGSHPPDRATPGTALNLLMLLALFFVNKFGAAGNIAFFGVAYLLALRGCLGVAQAVSMMALVIVGNVAFVTRTPGLFGALKFGLLILSATCLMTELRREGIHIHARSCYRALWMFVGVAAILALSLDHYLSISISKLLAFGVGFTVILGVSEVAAARKIDLAGWYVSFILFVVTTGLIALAMGVGFNAKTYSRFAMGLFNGPTYHPQTFGPACALMIVYLACLNWYGARPTPKASGLLTIILLGFLFFTSSRTGAITLFLGLSVAALYRLRTAPVSALVHRSRMAGNRIELSIIFGCLVLLVADLSSGGRLREFGGSFVLKTLNPGGYEEYRREALDRVFFSRRGQVNEMLENVARHPWRGIGFGISTSERFETRLTLFSAPTEKGFLPVAIVEETGVIGAVFFVLFIGSFYHYLLRRRNGPGLAMFSALLGANLGEMMFFSFGGHGLLMWVLVGGGLALGAPRPADADAPPNAPPNAQKPN